MNNRLHRRLGEQVRTSVLRRQFSYDHQLRWFKEALENGITLPDVTEIPVPIIKGNGERGMQTLRINNGKERG